MATRLAPSDPVELLRETGSLLEDGEFILSSGKRSSYYFDSKVLTLNPKGGLFVAEYFIEKLIATPVEAVGGMAHGAIPIISVIPSFSLKNVRPLPGFYVRQFAKIHGTKKLIEGNFPDDPTVPVAIIDDVVTKGGSILQAIDAVEERGNPINKVMCILDRNEGGRESLKKRGYTLEAMYTVVRNDNGKVKIIYNS